MDHSCVCLPMVICLHRKKILFSIRCLKNYAEAAFGQSASPPNAHYNQPQHHYTPSGKSSMVSSMMSPNSTLYDDGSGGSLVGVTTRDGSYNSSTNERRHGSLSGSPPARSNSVLDIMNPSRPEKVSHVKWLCMKKP